MRKTIFLKLIFFTFIIGITKVLTAEPFVVLQYNMEARKNFSENDNIFLKDFNYSTNHTVLKNETLSDIILNYYGFKSFNNEMLSLAIVHYNKKAFVRNNPNYLFSGKKLYLPSINEIKDLIIKSKEEKINNSSQSPLSSQIYFFGG